MSQSKRDDIEVRWEAALALFEAALDLDDSERSLFLEARCGDDVELLAEVRSLLEHHRRAGAGFLRPIEIGALPGAGDESDGLIGATISSFTIRSMIGRGGMGTVYLAEQANPKRDVALKIMHGGAWSASVERRFAVESRILAYLRHPNIAQVYEAGVHRLEAGATDHRRDAGTTARGLAWAKVQYFAMEYVPSARTITRYAADMALPIKERLELFLQLCDAVHHGHQKGIVHRDLKPANILVGHEGPRVRGAKGPSDEAKKQLAAEQSRARLEAVGVVQEGSLGERHKSSDEKSVSIEQCHSEVATAHAFERRPLPDGRGSDNPILKVIDFGIARTTDSDIAVTTMHTEVGQLLGTLAYMSPEQCAADPAGIDTTTDVYSLGVILFELLTGRLPYDVSNMTLQSAARIVCEQEPARPSLYERKLRGDLETIILKAIEKEQAKRYSTVAALAEDIRHHLEGQPISARPATRWIRAMRWVARRPKLAVALSSVLIAGLIVGSSVVSIYVVNRSPADLEIWMGNENWDGPMGRPHRIGGEARLISLGGGVLHKWKSGFTSGIAFGAFVIRPEIWGGDPVVLIGYSRHADSDYRGKLCFYECSRSYQTPTLAISLEEKHVTAMKENDWPRPEDDPGRSYSAGRFAVQKAWMCDVFPGDDHPGEEIVVNYMSDFGTQGTLSIYDLKGELLFQAWQDGGINDVFWLPEAGLLVCAAIKGDQDRHKLGLVLRGNHPSVLFAIRPRVGDISNKWIHPYPPRANLRFKGDSWKGEWYKPEWYRMPCPIDWSDVGFAILGLSEQTEWGLSARETLKLSFYFPHIPMPIGKFFLYQVSVNARGDLVGVGKPGDVVRIALRENPTLPDPHELKLLEWENVEPPCGTEADATKTQPTSAPATSSSVKQPGL